MLLSLLSLPPSYFLISQLFDGIAWPLHKDDTLFQSGRPMGLNIYFFFDIEAIKCGRGYRCLGK
ncbi:hypothetical protein L218DRAFT_878143 [Marasmius fiardii PR-910]|nr:hypothetical protein L218DRAFT_878143 [Marasmius fiardii PR-910]